MSNQHFTITEVQVEAPSRLQLTFADSERMQVDLSQIIPKYPTLAPLADSKIFKTAEVGEWGGCVVWNKDDNLELAADNLRARAIEQAGGCSHERIWNWMTRNNLTLDAAANELGLSRRMLAYYRSGEKPVPRTVGLAIIGWETLHKPAKPSPKTKAAYPMSTVEISRAVHAIGGLERMVRIKGLNRENALAASSGKVLITSNGPSKPPKTSSKKSA